MTLHYVTIGNHFLYLVMLSKYNGNKFTKLQQHIDQNDN